MAMEKQAKEDEKNEKEGRNPCCRTSEEAFGWFIKQLSPVIDCALLNILIQVVRYIGAIFFYFVVVTNRNDGTRERRRVNWPCEPTTNAYS